MISFWDKARLTLGYGKVLLVCGTLFNVVSAYLLGSYFAFGGISLSLILKAFSTVFVLYLMRQFEHRDAVFFYINLGLTRRGMLTAVLALDYLVWALLMTIIIIAQ